MPQYTICNESADTIETFSTDSPGEAEQTLACWLTAHGDFSSLYKMYREDMEWYEWSAWRKFPSGKAGTLVVVRDRFVGVDTYYKVSGDLSEAVAVDASSSAGRCILANTAGMGIWSAAMNVLNNPVKIPVLS